MFQYSNILKELESIRGIAHNVLYIGKCQCPICLKVANIKELISNYYIKDNIIDVSKFKEEKKGNNNLLKTTTE